MDSSQRTNATKMPFRVNITKVISVIPWVHMYKIIQIAGNGLINL